VFVFVDFAIDVPKIESKKAYQIDKDLSK